MGTAISNSNTLGSDQIIKYTRYRQTLETKRKRSINYLSTTFYNKDIKTRENSIVSRKFSDPTHDRFESDQTVRLQNCRVFHRIYTLREHAEFIGR